MMQNKKVLHENRFKIWQSIIALIMFCLFSVSVKSAVTDKLNKVGEGSMSWMFIDIYKASLFTLDGDYQVNDFPQALSITYRKDISKKRLIEATKGQWLLQGYEALQVEPWLEQLNTIWPNINRDDNLTFYFNSSSKATFYYNQKPIGDINDTDLASAFIAIWLSDKTSQPSLRRQLLGDSK